MDKNFIAIVPARGGSKGLLNKNKRLFAGKPLINWSIEFIKKVNLFDRCITSTDDLEISEIAKSAGSEVPFIRSKDLASDESSSLDVILDVIKRCDLKKDDIFFLFEPTSPYRKISDFHKIKNLYEQNDTESVVSVFEAMSKSYNFQYAIGTNKRIEKLPFNNESDGLRRQDVVPSYFLDGSFYSSRISHYLETKSFITSNTKMIFTDLYTSLEIDSLEDFKLLELIFDNWGSPF